MLGDMSTTRVASRLSPISKITEERGNQAVSGHICGHRGAALPSEAFGGRTGSFHVTQCTSPKSSSVKKKPLLVYVVQHIKTPDRSKLCLSSTDGLSRLPPYGDEL